MRVGGAYYYIQRNVRVGGCMVVVVENWSLKPEILSLILGALPRIQVIGGQRSVRIALPSLPPHHSGSAKKSHFFFATETTCSRKIMFTHFLVSSTNAIHNVPGVMIHMPNNLKEQHSWVDCTHYHSNWIFHPLFLSH